MRFIEVKALAGSTYVRAEDITAVQIVDQTKCSLILAAGVNIPVSEPAREVVARVEAALDGAVAAKRAS